MDKSKLKKIAQMALRGTPAEQAVAKRILNRHGVTADDLIGQDEPTERDENLFRRTDIGGDIRQSADEMIADLALEIRAAVSDASRSLSELISDFFNK